jgi:hypothetical protein
MQAAEDKKLTRPEFLKAMLELNGTPEAVPESEPAPEPERIDSS